MNIHDGWRGHLKEGVEMETNRNEAARPRIERKRNGRRNRRNRCKNRGSARIVQPYSAQLESGVRAHTDDPHHLAKVILDRQFTLKDQRTLAYWQGDFYQWKEGRYSVLNRKALQAHVNAAAKAEFDRIAKQTAKHRIKVTQQVVSNTVSALESTVMVEALSMPCWLGNAGSGRYFAFRNGLVSVDGALSGNPSLMGPTPKWLSTTCFSFDFDHAAKCERWRAFVTEVLPDDSCRHLLQQIFGYFLLPDTSQQKFFILEGKGRNGKGVVTSLLRSLLGPENVSSVPLEQFGERFALAPTIGKLANIVHELNKPKELAEGTLKSFVAGDCVTIDRKFREPISVLPTARLLITTNEWPDFRDKSDGIRRRLIPLRFDVQIPEEKVNLNLASELQAELPGIFNWALEGLKSLETAGFVIPEPSKALLAELTPPKDSAEMFLLGRCEVASESYVVTADLYDLYRTAVGEQVALSTAKFGQAIRRVYPNAKAQRETGAKRRWGYEGLTLKRG